MADPGRKDRNAPPILKMEKMKIFIKFLDVLQFYDFCFVKQLQRNTKHPVHCRGTRASIFFSLDENVHVLSPSSLPPATAFGLHSKTLNSDGTKWRKKKKKVQLSGASDYYGIARFRWLVIQQYIFSCRFISTLYPLPLYRH